MIRLTYLRPTNCDARSAAVIKIPDAVVLVGHCSRLLVVSLPRPSRHRGAPAFAPHCNERPTAHADSQRHTNNKRHSHPLTISPSPI